MVAKMSENSPAPLRSSESNLSPFILGILRQSDQVAANERKLSNFGLCDPYLLPNSVTRHIM